MKAVPLIGLALLIIGVMLQPVGWAYVHWVTPISFVAIAAGVLLLLHGRREVPGEVGSARARGGRDLPGDIHGHSGQLHGGRSTSWESHHSADGGGAAD
jgi:hypothetical protein